MGCIGPHLSTMDICEAPVHAEFHQTDCAAVSVFLAFPQEYARPAAPAVQADVPSNER